MNSGPPNQLPPCFLNLNWDRAMDPSGNVESSLTSIVSSQSSNSPATAPENLPFPKLVGGLQSIGSSGEDISPQSHYMGTPMNSPSKPNLPMMGHLHQHPPTMGGLSIPGNQMPLTHLDQFAADPGFAERAARFSSFDGRNYGQLANEFGLQNSRISRAAGKRCFKLNGLQMGLVGVNKEIPLPGALQPEVINCEFSNAREESSVSDPVSREVCLGGPVGSNTKKRKAPAKGKAKGSVLANPALEPFNVTEDDSTAKRCCSSENTFTENDTIRSKVEQNDGGSTPGNVGQKHSKESNAKPPEPPKDYIHVRARRGQATDSHSLAERVRRERISQRMKFLQDLVPGCNKVTGKAVMLDEIINYVQSLQRQVEFLSMKLATVNPQLDFNNLAHLLHKDMHQTCAPVQNSVYPLETSGMASSSLHSVMNNGMVNQRSLNLLGSASHQNLYTHQPFISEIDNASSQLRTNSGHQVSMLGTFWEDDLQSVVQMDMGQNQETAVSSQSIHGPLQTAHTKIEL